MNADIKKNTSTDGTIDDDYTWGRPVTTYVSTLQHFQLLLLKARVDATGAVDELHPHSAPAAEFLLRLPLSWHC